MRGIWSLTIWLTTPLLLLGCSAEEEENFPLEMCEAIAEGATTDLVARADIGSAPELSITEDHENAQVNMITGLSDAEATYIAFSSEVDGGLVLFADTAAVVTGLFEDGNQTTLPAGSPNGECEADIPEHWHLDDLMGGTTYALQIGPTAATELHLLIAYHVGAHDHEDG